MGLGVALGRRPLVDRDLAAGGWWRSSPDVIAAETAYWLVSSDSADYRPDLLRFKRWLLKEAGSFGDRPSATIVRPPARRGTGEDPSPVVEIFSFAAAAAPSPLLPRGGPDHVDQSAIPRSVPRNKTALVVLSGALVMSAAMGMRQTFGLFIGPFSFDRGMPVTQIAFAIALHNLVWGFAQPFAGAAADRHGPAPVVAFGAVAFAAGLASRRWRRRA